MHPPRHRPLLAAVSLAPMFLAAAELVPGVNLPQYSFRWIFAAQSAVLGALLLELFGVVPNLGLLAGFNRRHCTELAERVERLEMLLDLPEHLDLADLSGGVEDFLGELPEKRAQSLGHFSPGC